MCGNVLVNCDALLLVCLVMLILSSSKLLSGLVLITIDVHTEPLLNASAHSITSRKNTGGVQ